MESLMEQWKKQEEEGIQGKKEQEALKKARDIDLRFSKL